MLNIDKELCQWQINEITTMSGIPTSFVSHSKMDERPIPFSECNEYIYRLTKDELVELMSYHGDSA